MKTKTAEEIAKEISERSDTHSSEFVDGEAFERWLYGCTREERVIGSGVSWLEKKQMCR